MKGKAPEVSRKQLKQGRYDREENSGSDEIEEPQAKRMAGEESALAEHHEKVGKTCMLSCITVSISGYGYRVHPVIPVEASVVRYCYMHHIVMTTYFSGIHKF